MIMKSFHYLKTNTNEISHKWFAKLAHSFSFLEDGSTNLSFKYEEKKLKKSKKITTFERENCRGH